MKGVLLDTNIVLDFALERREFFEISKELLLLINELKIPAFITATNVTDIYYVLKKSKGHDLTISFLIGLFNFIDICGVNRETILNALHSEFHDFEDAVQSNSASEIGLQTIITRNISDFKNSNLKVLTPSAFIKQFKK
jgi:predicted nucleic acid-binding protein